MKAYLLFMLILSTGSCAVSENVVTSVASTSKTGDIDGFDKLAVFTRSVFDTRATVCKGKKISDINNLSVESPVEPVELVTKPKKQCVWLPHQYPSLTPWQDVTEKDRMRLGFLAEMEGRTVFEATVRLADLGDFDTVLYFSGLYRGDHSLDLYGWQVRLEQFLPLLDSVKHTYGLRETKFHIYVKNLKQFFAAEVSTYGNKIAISPGMLRAYYAVCSPYLSRILREDDSASQCHALEAKRDCSLALIECFMDMNDSTAYRKHSCEDRWDTRAVAQRRRDLAKNAQTCLHDAAAFTIAHELGHVFLRNASFDDSEINADRCALRVLTKMQNPRAIQFSKHFVNFIQFGNEEAKIPELKKRVEQIESTLSFDASNPCDRAFAATG